MGLFSGSGGTVRLKQESIKGRVMWVATCPHAKCREKFPDTDKAKARRAGEAHLKKAHPVVRAPKKDTCPGCGRALEKCAGKKPSCHKRKFADDKTFARSISDRHTGNHTPRGFKTKDGTRIPPGQNLNGIVYDAKGRRIWNAREALGQSDD